MRPTPQLRLSEEAATLLLRRIHRPNLEMLRRLRVEPQSCLTFSPPMWLQTTTRNSIQRRVLRMLHRESTLPMKRAPIVEEGLTSISTTRLALLHSEGDSGQHRLRHHWKRALRAATKYSRESVLRWHALSFSGHDAREQCKLIQSTQCDDETSGRIFEAQRREDFT